MREEYLVIGRGTEYPLNGILTLPEDLSKPVPAVVMVHGSGSSNMDEKIMNCTPFKDLAEGLAKRGVASVRYDKRSFVHARKMLKAKPITVQEETIEDAILATQRLKQDSRIDKERIFILGHSMGGMLAPRIDAEGGNYKGLILMAGSPRNLETILLEQNQTVMDSLNPFLRWIGEKQIKKLNQTFAGLYTLSDEEAKQKKFGGGTTLYYFKEMGEHPVPMYLEQLDKPMLVLQGAKDVQVLPEIDFQMYQELLRDKSDVTFRLYEELNHAFVKNLFGSLMKTKQEYSVERHIEEYVLQDIAEWILKH